MSQNNAVGFSIENMIYEFSDSSKYIAQNIVIICRIRVCE